MEQQTKEYSDEINLYELWKVIAKRKKIIITVFLVFVITAVIYSLLLPKIYQGEAVLMMQGASGMTVKDIPEFIGKIDNGKIEKILPKTHDSITDIQFSPFKDKDTKDKIVLIIESKDKDSIQPALSELIEYIKAIDLIKINVKEEQERLAKRSAELDIIIAASTGLLNDYRQMLKAGKLVPLGFNPVELNRKVADIKLEKLAVEQAIQRLKGGIEIANHLYVMDKPIKPRKKMNVALAGVTSIFLGVFLAFFLGYVEKIKNSNSA